MTISRNRFEIPYDAKGNLYQTQPYYHYSDRTAGGQIVWVKNEPFTLSLTIVTDEGSTAWWRKFIMWRSDDGRLFPMFTRDVCATLAHYEILRGRTEPIEWVVRKQGQQYGVAPAKENS